jgi:hypothetical protein
MGCSVSVINDTGVATLAKLLTIGGFIVISQDNLDPGASKTFKGLARVNYDVQLIQGGVTKSTSFVFLAVA